MNGVNKTLYIPLYGKAYVSQRGIILNDKSAEMIWAKEGFRLKGKSKSRWLAYYMGMRSRVFDDWTREMIKSNPDATVIHIGCGLDSRIDRVGGAARWYDADFPEVIAERCKYFNDTEDYNMISADVRNNSWLDSVFGETVVVVMEGVSMYLTPDELATLFGNIRERFGRVYLLMDCYTTLAARMSKIKNPINDVGVSQVYGMDDPEALSITGMKYTRELEMTPEYLINELSGMEKKLFKSLYAGKTSKKLYKLYEYKK